MRANTFISPAKIVIEQGGLAKSGQLIAPYGKKALICIGGGSAKKAGYVDILIKSLEESGMEYAIYEGIPSDPDVDAVLKGVDICKENGCDTVVAMGGGSVLDAAKAIGLLANNSETMQYYEKNRPENSMLPMLAIPTTAGTASEVTMYSIITDHVQKKKMVIACEEILPNIALLDVNLTVSMQKSIAAATGMDALTHAVESYISDRASMTTMLFAMKAIELIMPNICGAVYNPNNIEAKEAMLLGQMYAGLAFSNTSTALVHSMSRPLGVYYGIPHGESNAVLLATVMEFNLPTCVQKFSEIAKKVGIEPIAKGDMDYAKAFIERLKELHYSLPLRRTLNEMDVEEKDLRPMAESAFGAGSTGVNPRKPSVDEIVELYKKLM